MSHPIIWLITAFFAYFCVRMLLDGSSAEALGAASIAVIAIVAGLLTGLQK